MAHHDQLVSDMLHYTVTVDTETVPHPNLKLAQSTEHVRHLLVRHYRSLAVSYLAAFV